MLKLYFPTADLLEKSTVISNSKKCHLCSSVTDAYCVVRVWDNTVMKGINKPKDMQCSRLSFFSDGSDGLEWILLILVVF